MSLMTLEQFNLLQRGTTSFAMIVKIRTLPSKGNLTLRLALHTSKIIFGGEEYKPVPFEVSEFQAIAGTEIDNAMFTTLLSETFSRLGIRGGLWQGATVEMMVVDYTQPQIGYIERHCGRLGQSTVEGFGAETEYRGLMQLLSQEIGDKTSHLCRYQTGDERCKRNLADITFNGNVTAVTNNQKFTISVSKPDKFFYRGKIKFTSGKNDGLSMETQGNVGQILTLFMPMPEDVKTGDTFEIVRGDAKTLQACIELGNAINFGGEPDSPDRETLFKFPDS